MSKYRHRDRRDYKTVDKSRKVDPSIVAGLDLGESPRGLVSDFSVDRFFFPSPHLTDEQNLAIIQCYRGG